MISARVCITDTIIQDTNRLVFISTVKVVSNCVIATAINLSQRWVVLDFVSLSESHNLHI